MNRKGKRRAMDPSTHAEATPRPAPEAQLAAARAAFATLELSDDGIIVDANESFLQLMGYTRDEVLGRHHRILVDAVESETDAHARWWRSLREGPDGARGWELPLVGRTPSRGSAMHFFLFVPRPLSCGLGPIMIRKFRGFEFRKFRIL